MTPLKMPEPVAYAVTGRSEREVFAKILYFTIQEAKNTAAVLSQNYPIVEIKPLYTAEAVQECAKQYARDVLEQAAQVVEELAISCENTSPDAAEAIRAMKDQL